ncbi:MAG: alpha/beta fold hydrolase [Bacteriovorax sp.]|jgi:O-succinylbenzoic acid--CoA ligase
MNFDLYFHFKKYSENIFFNKKSYAEFSKDVGAFASKLKGLSCDSHIAVSTISPYFAMVSLFSCLLNNKTAVFLAHLESESTIEKLKTQINFNLIVRDFHFDDLESYFNTENFGEIELDKPACVVFSSGTTSLPKGVLLSFKNLFYSALGFAEYFKQHDQEASLINLPHHHVGGLMVLCRAFFSGGRVLTDINEKMDFISLVPLQLRRMIEDPQKLNFLKKVRVILIGGSALPKALKDAADTHKLNIFETYGMSESTSLVTINGEVLPYREIKLDESGHINIRGKTLATGFYINRNFIPINDWFKTNDLGEYSSVGIIRFLGRSDIIINCAGEKINPLLIEEIARQHPKISDACLLPVPDEKWGEIAVLLYDTNENSNDKDISEELKKSFKENLHPHHVPKFYFKVLLKSEGQLKLRRNDLKKIAYKYFLESIFSYDIFLHNDPGAPVLVLFHGFLGDKNELRVSALPLQEHYSLLFIDLPGHGGSKVENFHSLHDLMIKLKHFIELFSHSPLYYGYSMGGRVALELALHYLKPSMLWLESAGPGLLNDEEKSLRLSADMSLFDGIEQSTILNFLTKWYSNPMFRPYSEMTSFKADCEKKSAHDFNEWKLSQKFLSIGSFPLKSQVINLMKQIDFPIVYIYGEGDELYKSIAQMLSNSGLKNLSLREIVGAGHNPHKTHPSEITDILSISLK